MWALRQTVVLTGLALAFTSCAQIQRREAERIEPQLSDAGFQIRRAKTPEDLAKLQAMPQRKLRQTWREGKLYYVFADAQGCNCLYVGDKMAYDRYQANQAADRRDIVRQDEEYETMDENAAPDWGMWGIDSW